MNETIKPLFEISDVLPSPECSECQTSNVYNRFNGNYVFWNNDLQSPDFVSDIIDSGYRLSFKDSLPIKCFLRNNRTALNNPEFVESAILQLLKDGKIEEQSSVSFVSKRCL